MSGPSVFVEVDQQAYDRLMAKLEPGYLAEPLQQALIDLTLNAEREIKDRTPVKTGNLRRSIVSELSGASGLEPETSVWTDVEYANPVEAWANMFSDGAYMAIQSAGDVAGQFLAAIEKRWEE